MKKIILIIISSIFLSSCLWNSSEDGLISYNENQDFSLKIPNNWEIINEKEKVLPKPRSWEIELAVKSKTEKDWFFNNLLILSEQQKDEISAWEYIKENVKNFENDYFEYKKIEEKDFQFNDWKNSKLVVFEARYNKNTTKSKFLQTATFCSNKKIYFLTLAIPKEINDISKYEYMISTLNCKK